MKLYISGGITKVPNARNVFAVAKTTLEAAGYVVVNPFEVAPQCDGACNQKAPDNDYDLVAITHQGHTYDCLIEWDIYDMLRCDGVAVLPGWEESRGSHVLEVPAAINHGLDVKPVGWWLMHAGKFVQSEHDRDDRDQAQQPSNEEGQRREGADASGVPG